ncbi:MAG: Thioredoxin [Thermoanaerobacterales bacterium 50_218]|nr:MAG: Thioredoxin [Thermoanaerobacterales bacterium 50_218]HAA89649.1 thioredoxin [Peptococcaceae bacterium]
MSANVIELTSENFSEKISNSALPVLVDFWASWCGPCLMLAPVLEELAVEMEGKVLVGKVNVDENRQLAEQFGIMSIPTLILFRDGQEVSRIVGLRPKEELVKMINEAT